MGLEFVTKKPAAAKEKAATARLFPNVVRLNTKDNRFSFSDTVANKLNELKENPALNLTVGFAYDSENKEVYVFPAKVEEDGLAVGESRSFTDKYHTEKFVSTLNLEEHKGKVLVFEADLDEPVDFEGRTLLKLTFSEAQEPRVIQRKAKSTDPGDGNDTAESQAEKEGDRPTDASELHPTSSAQVDTMWADKEANAAPGGDVKGE